MNTCQVLPQNNIYQDCMGQLRSRAERETLLCEASVEVHTLRPWAICVALVACWSTLC